jgi:hypothetical protein
MQPLIHFVVGPARLNDPPTVDTRKIKISKLEAARRQLDTAIRLYFANGDPVSTQTLAAAAFEILKDLDKHGPKTGTFHDRIQVNVKPEYRKYVLNLFKESQNFFKHADQDPEKILEFGLAWPEYYLANASEKYRELAAEQSAEMFVYALWFSFQNPQLLTPLAAKHFAQLQGPEKYSSNQRLEFFTEYIQLASLALARDPTIKSR